MLNKIETTLKKLYLYLIQVLQSITKYYKVLQSITKYYKVLQSITNKGTHVLSSSTFDFANGLIYVTILFRLRIDPL
jgi:hypothetical protein